MIEKAKLVEIYEQCVAEREIAAAMFDDKKMDYEHFKTLIDRSDDVLTLIHEVEKLIEDNRKMKQELFDIHIWLKKYEDRTCEFCNYASIDKELDLVCIRDKSKNCADYVEDDDSCGYWESKYVN